MSRRLLLLAFRRQCRQQQRQPSSILGIHRCFLPEVATVRPFETTLSIQTGRRWFSAEGNTSNSEAAASVIETTPSKKKKKRATSRTKKLNIQLVQLQELHSAETVEEHFEIIARRSELGKLKWMDTLENQLLLGKEKSKPSSPSSLDKKKRKTETFDDAWNRAQGFMNHRKSIPSHVKDGFWDLIVAKTSRKREPKKKTSSTNVIVLQEDHTKVFQRARELSIEFPFFWSARRKLKVQKMLRKENSTLSQYLQQRSEAIGNLHGSKSSADQELEAQQLVETLGERLPPKYYERLVQCFEEFVEACEQEKQSPKTTPNDDGDEEEEEDNMVMTADSELEDLAQKDDSNTKRKKRIKMLFSNLRAQTQSHVHLVASELADFFYVTLSDESSVERDDTMVSSDPRIVASQKAWNDAKDQFVASFLSIQFLLFEEHEKKTSISQQGKDSADDDSQQTTRDYDDDNNPVVHDDSSEDSILATFRGAAAATDEVKPTSNHRIKPREYVIFEAISISDWATSRGGQVLPESTLQGTPLEGSSFTPTPPLDRLVFIDNLPIDMSEQRLIEAYSRCGSVQDLQIVHSRPELDPGRRSIDSRKKIRNPSNGRQKWERPRTPLYAMVLFKDAAGAAKAVSDPLRIFGMVLDKHLIRSHRASDMTTLYLEDISATQDVTSVEYQLSQLLHPELYVCLDIGKRQRYRKNRPVSCSIKFPNFEAAYWSYLKLSAELDLLKEEDTCGLHWMATPQDAMLYWTRYLNF